MKAIKITADSEISIIDIDFNNQESVQESVGKCAIAVTTKKMYDFFKMPIVMLTNGLGWIDDLEFNPLGTAFYEGTPIAGDIVLAQPADAFGGLEGIGDPEKIIHMLMKEFSFLERI